jgi:hypothetical protein
MTVSRQATIGVSQLPGSWRPEITADRRQTRITPDSVSVQAAKQSGSRICSNEAAEYWKMDRHFVHETANHSFRRK